MIRERVARLRAVERDQRDAVADFAQQLAGSGVDFDPTFCHLNHSRFESTEVAISRNLLNDDHLAAWLGRIDQFHLRRPIDQDGALIDVSLVGDLARRQRGWLLKEREGADTLAASDTGIVKPEALLEKRDHARRRSSDCHQRWWRASWP